MLRNQSLVFASSGRCGEVSQALALESLDHFFGVSKQGPCLTAIEEDGGDKILVELKLVCEADGVVQPDPV